MPIPPQLLYVGLPVLFILIVLLALLDGDFIRLRYRTWRIVEAIAGVILLVGACVVVLGMSLHMSVS